MTKDRKYSSLFLRVFGICFIFGILFFNFSLAIHAGPSLSIVDGWAVFNRIRHFNAGDISWDQYLFTPHGAHLNFSVYLIAFIDYVWGNGKQELMRGISLACTGGLALFLIERVRKSANNEINPTATILACGATAALISCVADCETLFDPYEVALSAARLSYAVLLWIIIKALYEKQNIIYAISLLFSMLAVTFHGTGYIYAVCLILVHLLSRQNRWRIALSFLPFASVILLQAHYSTGPSELSLSRISHALSNRPTQDFSVGLFGFFAAPFRLLWPNILSTGQILLLGSLLMSLTIIMSLVGIWKCLNPDSLPLLTCCQSIWKKDSSQAKMKPEVVYFTATGVFVLLSAAAAVAFWLVRGDLDNSKQPSYFYILTSARYGYYGSISCIMIMAVMLHKYHKREVRVAFRFLNAAVPAALILLSLYLSELGMAAYRSDDEVNLALAGISAGLSPLLSETEAIFPDAKSDWYWKTELPMTVNYLQTKHKGVWNQLPSLGDKFSSSSHILINNIHQSPLSSSADTAQCKIDATIPVWGQHIASSSHLVPVISEGGIVIGYAVITRQSANDYARQIRGFMTCASDTSISEPHYVLLDR